MFSLHNWYQNLKSNQSSTPVVTFLQRLQMIHITITREVWRYSEWTVTWSAAGRRVLAQFMIIIWAAEMQMACFQGVPVVFLIRL